ncbi:MAG: hypothetical protein JWM57_284 [Phycisphaerales bacterium]|nr:hypothetical protein [Phycisphaerales bacterium]
MRVYDAAAPVQSAKRGVAANFLNPSDFTALNPGVSWWYNYSVTPSQTVPANSGMNFYPMVYNGIPSSLTSLSNYLAAGNRPLEIMTVNEPNITGQAVMTPTAAATVYKNVKAIADPYGIPVSGPQMPSGGNTGVTSTAQYLTQFYQAANANSTTVTGVGTHIYDNFGGFTYNLGQAISSAGGRALNVSEFAYYDAASDAEQLSYLVKAVDTLENNPGVKDYAWFKERTTSSAHIALLSPQAGVLSALGVAYVNMPVHDADVFYRPNGRLQAERYTTATNASIGVTGDVGADSLADMTASAANAKLNYNLFVEQAGLYEVKLRVSGEFGNLTLLDGATPLSTISMTAGAFRTVVTQVYLNAGYDTLTLQLQRSGQVVNYLEFTAVPEPATGLLFITGGFAFCSRRVRPVRERCL